MTDMQYACIPVTVQFSRKGGKKQVLFLNWRLINLEIFFLAFPVETAHF